MAGLVQLVHHLRQLVAPHEPAPDAVLLGRFIQGRDELAFEALVARHGPMVRRVCRRVLLDATAADDCFQAVFLILARKAPTLRRPAALACWLHGVALRVASEARKARYRRRLCPLPANSAELPDPHPDPLEQMTARELLVALDEEVRRLPEAYRLPVILCCLENLSQEATARRLGWTAGSVKARLERGRKRLQARLAKRGLTLSAALVAMAVSRGAASATVGPGLRAATTKAAMLFVAGLTGKGGAATGTAIILAEAALYSLSAVGLKLGVAVMLMASAIVAGLCVIARQVPKENPAATAIQFTAQTTKLEIKKPATRSDAYGDPLPAGAITRLGTLRFNHGAGLSHLLFTPDGKTIISEGNQTVRLWNAATGRELGQFRQPDRIITVTALSLSDGNTLVSLNEESAGIFVRWWDLSQMKEVHNLQLRGQRSSFSSQDHIALTSDGTLAVIHVQTPAEMRIFDLPSGRELHKFADGGKDIRAVVFAGNDRLVTADKKQVISVCEARTGKLIRRFDHQGPVDFLIVSVDGRRLASFERHGLGKWHDTNMYVVHVWDLATGRHEHALKRTAKSQFGNAMFSPDGKRLITSSFGADYVNKLTEWDLATGQVVREMDGSGMRLAFSADGKRLAEGEGYGGNHGKFDVWDMEHGHRVFSDDNRLEAANAACLSWDGERVVTFSPSSISSWHGATGKRLGTLPLPYDPYGDRASQTPHGRRAVAFVRDGENYQTVVWDVGGAHKIFTVPAPSQHVPGATALSADGSMLATAHFNKITTVRVWDISGGKEVCAFTRPSYIGRLFFSGDNKTLILAGPKISAVDVASGKELTSWRMEPLKSARQTTMMVVGGPPFDENSRIAWRALAISPNGSTIAAIHETGWSGGRGQKPREDRIALYELATGKIIRQWNDSHRPANLGDALTFSDDGRLLASSEGYANDIWDTPAVHVWEAATGAKVRTFQAHRGEIASIGFDRDTRHLVSASLDSTVLVWDLTGRLRDGKLQPNHLSAPEFAALWGDLADRDAATAHRAAWKLTASGEQAVGFLVQRLNPIPQPDPKRIDRLISDLNSEQFADRQTAFVELKKLDVLAEDALSKTLKAHPSLEMRRRVESLLQEIQGPVPTVDALRMIRAVAVLEHVASPPASQLLQTLAQGAPAATLTREARATLDRLLLDSGRK